MPDDNLDDYNAIIDAINAARNLDGLTIIYFPEGVYDIFSRIELTKDDNNIVFQGNGSESSILRFDISYTTQCFYIHGEQENIEIDLVQDIPKGSKELYGNGMDILNDEDWIRLCECNFPVHNSIWNPFTDDYWAQGCVGQITQIDTIFNDQYALIKDEASKDYYDNFNIKVYKITPIQNIGFEKLKIIRNNAGSNDKGSNIKFEYAVNCWIKGVEFYKTSRHHIDIRYSSHIYISGCYFHEANSYGDKGRGYGVVLNFSTTNCLIENNIFRKLRHAMAVQAGANANVFAYNYSREQKWNYSGQGADICIHGNYPYANLFEENNIEYIKADDTHGMNGPYNTFVRNIVYNDDENYLYFIHLDNAENCNVLGCNNGNGNKDPFVYPPLGYEYTPDTDIYGFEMYIDNIPYYPWNHNNSYIAGERPYLLMKDISYYYSSRPDFLDVSYGNYSWPSCGPAVHPDDNITQSIPARERWFYATLKTYINDPTQWPPQPLEVTITGPTSLNSGQSGTYTAHPSGGSGTYTNYEWWERKDDLGPYSAGGGVGINAPPSNQWVYLTSGPDKQQITISRTYSFSLKCVVTDSYNDQATSNILSVHVSGGGAFAKQNADQTAPIAQVQIPEEVELNGNFPNPFNPTTTIKFGLPEDGHVQLNIYSMNGQKVRTLIDGPVSKGYHLIVWDGTNESGQPVSGGLYVYELKTDNKRILKKMLLVK